MTLKENPFYILDVDLSSDRHKIAEAADEAGFLLGSDKSGDAQSILTNPSKRLKAELSWFPEATKDDIASIRNSISCDQPISTSELKGYSKLNALVYNLGLGINGDSLIYEIGFPVISIDEQYSAIDVAQLTKTINQAREKAGISAVTENEVQECHRSTIESIRKLINDKLKPYDDDEYVHFVTIIAEQYIAEKRYNAGPILYDIVDQYEIRMQSEIDTRSNQIIQYVDLIKSEQNEDIIKKSIPKVIERVQAWDTYAQPLQLRSQASGLPHESSRKLAYEMRGLILYLNNERHMASEAKELAVAMKEVFLELGEFKELFSNDTEKLDEIVKDHKNAKEINEGIMPDLEKLEQAEKRPTAYYLEPVNLKEYVALVKSINEKILKSSLDEKTKLELRKAVFYRARKMSVDIYNNEHNPLVSKYISCVLSDLFSDIKEAQSKLSDDIYRLNQDVGANDITLSNYTHFFDKYIGPRAMKEKLEKKARIKKWVFGIAALVLVLILIINNTGKKQSGSRNNTSSYSGNSTAKYTDKPTTKPTTVPESAYSTTSKAGDYIYVDVVSIEPLHAIYTTRTINNRSTGFSYYSQFICECETSTGKKVWVFFDASDFKKEIDPTLSDYVSTVTNTFDSPTKYFSPAARIHGKASTAEYLLSGLSNKYSVIAEMNTDTVIKFSSMDVPEQLTVLTPENIHLYFDINVEGKEFDSRKGLTVTYSIKPKSTGFATKEGVSSDISVKLQIQASKIMNGDPFKTKDYTVVLKRSRLYSATGEIQVPFTMDLETVYWGYSIESCDGTVGKK